MLKMRKNFLIGSLLFLSCVVGAASTWADSLDKYVESLPGYGLLTNEVKVKGVTFRDFHFPNGKKYISVDPNQVFEGEISYDIDASQLESLEFHHFIIGLYDEQAQDTIVHTLGLFDEHNKTSVTFKAPAKRGVYQVRVCYGKGLTFENAKKYWGKEGQPDSTHTVGLVVVK